MSFWDVEGENLAQTATKEYEIPGVGMDLIPDNSNLLAIIDGAKWQHHDRNDKSSPRFIELKWKVLKPEALQNRTVFHKLWVTDIDPNTKDETKAKAKQSKARRMLASIDSNAGGNLLKSGSEPTEDSMTLHLCNKPMVIKVMIYDIANKDGSRNTGNFVAAVRTSDSAVNVGDKKPPKAGGGSGQTPAAQGNALDDDIPFAPVTLI